MLELNKDLVQDYCFTTSKKKLDIRYKEPCIHVVS